MTVSFELSFEYGKEEEEEFGSVESFINHPWSPKTDIGAIIYQNYFSL